MRTQIRRVGEVARLVRRPIELDPLETYTQIGVRSFGRGIFHYDPVTGDQLGKLRYFHIQPSDLVVSNIKAWEGAVAVAGVGEQGCIGSNRFLAYVPDPKAADVRYLRYFFLSEEGLTLLQQASPGSADRNRTLAIDRFDRIELPLPDLDEQHRVADKLDRLLERVGVITLAGRRSQAGKLVSLYPGLVDGVLGRYASGRSRIGDLVDFVSDVVHPGDEAAPADRFVGLQHIESHTGRRQGELPIGGEKGRKLRFLPGDVIYGYLRPYLNKVWLADCSGLCSVDQYVLRPTGMSGALLAHALRSRAFLVEAIRLTHNLQLPRLRSGLLANLEIPLVRGSGEKRALAELDAGLERVLRLLDLRKHSTSLAGALRPAILSRAFTGEL